MERKYLFKNVMVVDDSDLDRFISATVIKNDLFAAEIAAFNSVTTASLHLQTLANEHTAFPLVIFLDVNMPVLDGFDFLDAYLKFPEDLRKNCTVIMISATNSEEDFRRLNTYPIVRMFFNKPLSIKILNDIRRHLSEISS